MDKLYTVEEVADLASVTPRTIRNYLKDGRISGRKIGGQWRFSEAEVQRLLSGEEPAQITTEELSKPPQYLQDPKETENGNTEKNLQDNPDAFFIEDEEEIYHDAPMVFHTDKNNNFIEFNPEASLATENYEAAIIPAEKAETSDQPIRLPYAMPVKENIGHTTVPVAGATSPGYNPAFPHLDPSQPVAEPPMLQPVQPSIASPYGAQVPGNPQINYLAGQQIPQQAYAMPHPNMPMFYTTPSPYAAPVLASPIYPAPYAPYPAPPYQQYIPPAPLAPEAPAERPLVAYKPSDHIEEKPSNEMSKKQAEEPANASGTEKEFPFELSDIGTQVALFASEVHDCSHGPQICTMIDLYQSLASAKITSERLMEIADQESEFGVHCHCYVEFDTRYYISRYTLFGTSDFLARCLKLLG